MPTGALALVLLAGVIHASWNIVAKQAGGDVRFAAFTSITMSLFWAPLGIWLALRQVPGWGAAQWGVVLASGLLHTAYFLALLRGYRQSDLTVVYPLARGSGPLLSTVGAVLLLGEQLSALGALGVLAVVGGVFLVAGGPALWRGARGAADAAQRRRVLLGVGWGLLTGMFIAGYTVVDGWGVKVLAMSPILVDYMGNLLRTALLAPVVLRDRQGAAAVWGAQWRHALFVGIISPVSYVMVLYAAQSAPLSHVAPAREVSMLFAALIGGQLLREGDRLPRLAGALLIGAGVLGLALG